MISRGKKKKQEGYWYRAVPSLLVGGLFLSICLLCTPLANAKAPHGIILISLDTLRADHLGIYGYHRNTSPNIDEFSKESVVFENTTVQSPWTLPSHMSIMTSLYPSFHGVVNETSRLASETVTLAELLQEGGYKTAAFTDGGWVRKEFGFNQGFDVFDGKQTEGIAHILPRVKKWLDENRSNPFFLFIHCYDIHDPYNPPPPYNSIFHDFDSTGILAPTHRNLYAANRNKLKVTHEDIRHFTALYDGGIRYTDEKIGEFLSYLRHTQLYDRSLILITSDHGEEFREHGKFLHRQLYYETNLHVPLILRIPDYPKKEIRIKDLVRSIDLLPTIVELAELPSHQAAQGKSLLPLIKRSSNIAQRALWEIMHFFETESTISFAEYGSWSAITDGYQMINSEKPDYIQLFNLRVDPLAKDNIAEEHEDLTKKLLSRWEELSNTKSASPATLTIDLNEQTRKQLEELGYVDILSASSHNGNDADGDGVPDDKDNCPNWRSTHQQDSDGDGVGDVCDNCPHDTNPNQDDDDGDFTGNACDECTDTDWDGYGNPHYPNKCAVDNCPSLFNPDQEDSYPPGGNTVGDTCDCEGNFDCDDDADGSDLQALKKNFGRGQFQNPCKNSAPCNGDFDCDMDVDGTDAQIFKNDFGRSQYQNPCPPCVVEPWCTYP